MTNGRSVTMTSFMTKKKKYKFTIEIYLEELLEVPFVSAVLFAKLRLLDGGNFLDYTNREEVVDHTVKWGAKFQFTCKMMANASTGVLERCVLRISIRKEFKGGRSFNKLGFVDLNLAEYAGAGVTNKKALLEGYDSRHRQDNSMLRFSVKMCMLSGDILFKVPSPSHKPVGSEENNTDSRGPDDYSGGSIASGSSGFGSLPKKRTPLLSSDLVIGHALPESNVPVTLSIEQSSDNIPSLTTEAEEVHCEQGHSRNSSNTSQMSKASGYSSIHSHTHSRQSSSGDSGHIRVMSHRKLLDGTQGGKLAPVIISPDETPATMTSECSQTPTIRRPSVTTNPSSSSLVLSETGSLDRAKAALERRKKAQLQENEGGGSTTGRVEETRVNPDHLIAEILKNTNLEQADDSAETSGLQLFIAKDGTAALGNHEIKSQMSNSMQLFKQVVVEDNR